MENEKYKETKICKCIACGKEVEVTKFASAAKVMCPDCKESGAQPDGDIIASIQPKKIEIHAKYNGNTKILPCIKCGKDVEVTKFASAAKVICDECKGESGGYAQHDEIVLNPIIHMDKLDRNIIPELEEYHTTSALINNSALRNIKCPACGHEYMKILRVMDWSTFGLVAHYQCPKCKLLVSVSEQTKILLKSFGEGMVYDYSGKEIEAAGISSIDSSRMSMTIQKLMGILKEHNIEIEGDDLPPYLYDENRPVPVGYRIPDGDKSIKIVDDTIKILDESQRMGQLIDTPEGARYIQISDTMAKGMSDKLKELFKDGEQ